MASKKVPTSPGCTGLLNCTSTVEVVLTFAAPLPGVIETAPPAIEPRTSGGFGSGPTVVAVQTSCARILLSESRTALVTTSRIRLVVGKVLKLESVLSGSGTNTNDFGFTNSSSPEKALPATEPSWLTAFPVPGKPTASGSRATNSKSPSPSGSTASTPRISTSWPPRLT